MNLELNGRVALVLGAGGGLGGAIARKLANEGARVVVADIDGVSAQRVASGISEAGGEALALPWDIADMALVDTRVAQIESTWGGVDILVNNTGGPPPTTVSGQPPDVWSKYFQSMVLSVIGITDRVLPGMRQRFHGRVITSVSSGVIAPIANLGLSNALRASLVGWSKTLAQEVGRDGITTNIVVPGRIATDRIRFLDEAKAQRESRQLSDVVAQSTGATALGRYGEPEEYADMVTFLASARAAYITGSIFRVDGGLIGSV